MFGPLKEALEGKRFNDDAMVEEYMRNWLGASSFFDEGIKKLSGGENAFPWNYVEK